MRAAGAAVRLTNTVTDDDAFGNLQGASIAWNASDFTTWSRRKKQKAWNVWLNDLHYRSSR